MPKIIESSTRFFWEQQQSWQLQLPVQGDLSATFQREGHVSRTYRKQKMDLAHSTSPMC